MLKPFTILIFIISILFVSCGGGGSSYTEESPSGCVSSATNFCVKVVSTDSGNKYSIDGTTQKTLTLTAGTEYTFDQTDSTNASHPLALSETANGTHASGTEYTTGVTTTGTAGSTGKTTFTPASNAPTPLYYFCKSHSGMGGTVNISGISSTYSATGSIPEKIEVVESE